jgi:hypothetical protein
MDQSTDSLVNELGLDEPSQVTGDDTESSDGATKHEGRIEDSPEGRDSDGDAIDGSIPVVSGFDLPDLPAVHVIDAGTSSINERSAFGAPDSGPVASEGPAPASESKRGRGRPPGSVSKKETVSSTLAGISSMLQGIHMAVGAIASAPELELSDDEAAKIAGLIEKGQKLYPVQLDPKKLFWAEFAVVMSGIYIPKAVAIGKRKARTAGPKLVTMPAPPKEPATQGQPRTATPQNGTQVKGITQDELAALHHAGMGVSD